MTSRTNISRYRLLWFGRKVSLCIRGVAPQHGYIPRISPGLTQPLPSQCERCEGLCCVSVPCPSRLIRVYEAIRSLDAFDVSNTVPRRLCGAMEPLFEHSHPPAPLLLWLWLMPGTASPPPETLCSTVSFDSTPKAEKDPDTRVPGAAVCLLVRHCI